MNAKELARRVEQILGFNPAYIFGDAWDTDWRVAGALMERCIGLTVAELEIDSGYGRGWEVYNTFAPGTNKDGGDQSYRYTKANDESLPRAIIKACVEALASDDD